MAFAKLKRWCAGWGTALYAGALFAVVAGRVADPQGGLGAILVLAMAGALYGLGVLGLMRVFGARRWGLIVAGALCGPVPAVLLFISPQTPEGDRGGVWFFGVVVGLVLGLLEWNRTAREAP